MNGRERVNAYDRIIFGGGLAQEERESIIADLDTPIRWRPIAEYDRTNDEPRLFCERGYCYIGSFDVDDEQFEDWEGCEKNPTPLVPSHHPGACAMRPTERDFTVTRATIGSTGENHIVITWGTKRAGFGELTLYRRDDGTWWCDSECMSPAFVASVLAFLASTIRDPSWALEATDDE